MAWKVDIHDAGWLGRWLRAAFWDGALDPAEVDAALHGWVLATPGDPAAGSRTLLAWLAYIALPHVDTTDPRAAALQFAVGLATLADCEPQARVLQAALGRHREGGDGAVPPDRRAMGAALAPIGRALAGRVADGVDGWLGAATLAVVAAGDRRLLLQVRTALRSEGLTDLGPEARATLADLRRHDHVTVLEAIVGLIRADGRVDTRERRLVNAALRAVGARPGEARLVTRMLEHGGEDVEGLATSLPSAVERQALLVLLEVAALVDGEADERESSWIDGVADALGASAQERLLAHGAVLHHADAGRAALLRSLGRVALAEDASRRAERQVRAVVRANLRSVRREVAETGDLVVLLAAATQRPLSEPEAARMRSQLLDLCRTVPALAIFAAPGGAVLLPLLARVLPFSLRPSAFEDEGL